MVCEFLVWDDVWGSGVLCHFIDQYEGSCNSFWCWFSSHQTGPAYHEVPTALARTSEGTDDWITSYVKQHWLSDTTKLKLAIHLGGSQLDKKLCISLELVGLLPKDMEVRGSFSCSLLPCQCRVACVEMFQSQIHTFIWLLERPLRCIMHPLISFAKQFNIQQHKLGNGKLCNALPMFPGPYNSRV